MKVTRLPLDGLVEIALTVHRDARGFFVECYREEGFAEYGLPRRFAQDNHSRSSPGVLRGLHFQHDPAQGKLVMVIRGRIWDVAVDLRPGSPTFGWHHVAELSEASGILLWVPAGFAHGFCVLGSEPADVLYKVDAPYRPEGEGGLYWADPDLAIPWPLPTPIVSERDARLPRFAEYRSKLPPLTRGARPK
jgi:dTDP-4-dehydrorhamnose 3,5-epimerase